MNSEKAEKNNHNPSKTDEGRTKTRYNWRGDWIVNSRDRWKNLKVIRNRHHIRESYIKPDKLTYNLITVYMGAPSRQQALLSGQQLQHSANRRKCHRDFSEATALQSWYDEVEQDDVYLHLEPEFVKSVAEGAEMNPDKVEIIIRARIAQSDHRINGANGVRRTPARHTSNRQQSFRRFNRQSARRAAFARIFNR